MNTSIIIPNYNGLRFLAPACFLLLGSANADLGLNAAHHNPRFDFDERVLPIGVALLATTATRFLAEKALV